MGYGQLAALEVVVADRAGRQPVHMDGDGSGLVIHAVEALAGDQNVSPGRTHWGGWPIVSGSFQARPSIT